jgi:TP901 family phage tail tape measure protein
MLGDLYNHLINVQFKTSGAEDTKTKIKQINDALGGTGKITDKLPAAGVKINDFQKALARAAVVAPVWMVLRGAMLSVINLVKSQIKFILEMEDAMARIQIVGKGTAEEYDNLKYSLIGLSLAYGVSASEAMEAAKVFAQQGKTVAETFTLTRAAMIGAQVLGENVKTVVEDLTAAMNAFNIPANNAISIIDNLINVEKQFAVTSVDLSSGIKVTGATANQMGVTLAELAGHITAIIEVTRKSGAEAARGLQFIYARLLTSAKPIIEQLTGIKFYLDEQGKSTSALTGKLRSSTDVLDELALKWSSLSNEEKLNIAVATGSKRQITVMMALMQNYNHAIDARITALVSAGEAEKALGIIQETTSYKMKQLGSAWNALTATIADTSAFKNLLDNITYAITFYAKLTNAVNGYRIELAKESGAELAIIEAQQNQISSINELIKLRNKLLSVPPADENTERINKLNEAITTITEGNPTIKLAIESGKSEELKKAVNDINDMLLRKKIVSQVKVDFLPDLKALSDKKSDLQKALDAIAPVAKNILGKNISKQIEEINKKSLELQKKQTAEIQKQFKLTKAEKLTKQLEDEDEMFTLVGE